MLGGGSSSVLGMGEHPADGSTGGFPVGCRVVCQGLVGAAEYNGAVGVVRGPLNAKGRHNVWVDAADKCLLLKADNLAPEPRALESLTVAELKAVLVAKGSPAAAAGSEDDEVALRELVECEVMPDDDLSLLIAQVRKRERERGTSSRCCCRSRSKRKERSGAVKGGRVQWR